MSLPPKPQYAIVATDRTAGVRVGARVVYSLVRTNVLASSGGHEARIAQTEDAIAAEYPLGHPYAQDEVLQPRLRWVLLPERSLHLEPVAQTDGFADAVAAGPYDVEVTWARPGTHRIKCFIETPAPWKPATQVATFSQNVRSPEDDAFASELSWNFALTVSREVQVAVAKTSPERAAAAMFRAVEAADELESLHPSDPGEAQWAHRRARAQQLEHAAKLYELVERLDAADHQRHAIVAVHVCSVDDVWLRVFVAIGREPRVSRLDEAGEPALAQVRIVDWTDASDEAYSGIYAGAAQSTAGALARALLRWRQRSHYPEGEMRFELPPAVAELLSAAVANRRLSPAMVDALATELGLDVAGHRPGLPLQGRFETHAQRDLAQLLDHVALTSALLAMAAAFASPIPGSRVVAGLLWTSAVSGAAGSTIRIATRRDRGVVDTTATAFDVLSIVSSLMVLPAATAVWRQGATIALREAVVHGAGRKVLKMSLVGQIGADGLQGVLVAADAMKEIGTLLEDGRQPPGRRLEQASAAVARLVATGALVVIGAKGNLDDLARRRTEPSGLQRLADPQAEIELVDGEGAHGDTRQGKHVTVADDELPLSAQPIVRGPELTPNARAALGELDEAAKLRVRAMLEADEGGANLLLERFGHEALDVAEQFVTVCTRWDDYVLPQSWLRHVHQHTGLHGVRYLANLPAGAPSHFEYAAAGWACERETHFRAVFKNAGHSIARHGPQIPDEVGDVLEQRVTQGYAAEVAEHVQVDAAGHPDGTTKWQRVASPSRRSTRFLSFADWNDAHDSAYLTLEKQFKSAGADRAHGPIVGPTGEPFAMASGYIEFLDIDDPGSVIVRPLGEGYEGVKDGTERTARFRRPDGSELEDVVYPTTARTPRGDIRYVYATMGWTGSEWVLINLYPAAKRKPTTVIGLKKDPVKRDGVNQQTVVEH